MKGKSNSLGTEKLLFSHCIILYVTGKLCKSMKYESICFAEDNQVTKLGFTSPPAPPCICQHSPGMHPNVLS